MRVLVAGAGAVGRWIAARLSCAAIDCGLVPRRPSDAARFAAAGIALHEADGSVVRVPVRAVSEPAPSWDLLAVCVKAHDVGAAVERCVRGLTPEGLVLVLSNGLGNLETVESRWEPARCLAGVVYAGALREGDTGVRVTGDGRVRVGGRHGRRAEAAAVTALLARAGIRAEPVDDIDRELWKKAALNCALNAVAAVVGVENGRLPATPAFAAAVRTAEEVAAVARAAGVALAESNWSESLAELCAHTAANRCSMLEDLAAGRRTEIDALSGRVAAMAVEYGLDAPLNACLARLIRALDEGARSEKAKREE